jgi:hypothetical protein
MHEFFLHEAQAQLQMALFGMDEEFMESTNSKIRDAFSGTNPDENFAKDMCTFFFCWFVYTDGSHVHAHA